MGMRKVNYAREVDPVAFCHRDDGHCRNHRHLGQQRYQGFFLFGFNVLLPVTFLHVLYSDGDPARHTLLLAMVGIYQIRMNFILILWYRNTAAAKLKDILPPAEIYLLPVLLTNVAGWIYCLPFVWTVDRPGPLDRLDLIVVCVYVLGTIFHFGSDFQKHRFKQRPDSYGRVLDTGFWGISRHPNYFGDFLIYIAFGLSAGNFLGLHFPARKSCTVPGRCHTEE